MKLNRILLPAMLVAALAVVPGCKKEDTTKKTLEGYLSLTLPEYMGEGESKEFMIDSLMTLICPDGEPIGYYFYDAETEIADTLVTADGDIVKHYYTYTAPDKIGSAKLTLGGFMGKDSQYSGFSTYYTTTVVQPGLSGPVLPQQLRRPPELRRPDGRRVCLRFHAAYLLLCKPSRRRSDGGLRFVPFIGQVS